MRALLAVVVVAAFAVVVPMASAADICVGSSPLCPVDSGLTIQQAFTAAKDGSHVGPDRVFIASGTYDVAGASYTDAPGESLEVIGQGDSTVIRPSIAGYFTLILNFTNTGDASSVRDLKLGTISPQADTSIGLDLNGGKSDRVNIETNADGATFAVGARLRGGAVLKNSKVDLLTTATRAVRIDNGSTSIDGLSVDGGGKTNTVGVYVGYGAAANLSMSRSRITGVVNPIYALYGDRLSVSDSLIDIGTLSGVKAIYASYSNPTTTVDISHVTIIGDGDNQIGVNTVVGAAGGLSATLTNSIIDLHGTAPADVNCSSSNPDSAAASFAANWLFTDPSNHVSNNCTSTLANTIDRAGQPSPFVDRAGGDFHLATGSALIDAGDPAFAAASGETDLDGQPRVRGGNGTCVARTDLGAYEFVPTYSCETPTAPPIETTPANVIKLAKPYGTFKLGKKSKKFALSSKRRKPSIKLTTNFAGSVSVVLTKSKGGYVSGKKCSKTRPKSGKIKRCDLKIASAKLKAKAGASYLTWTPYKLKTGKYKLTVTGPGGAKSSVTLKVVRK